MRTKSKPVAKKANPQPKTAGRKPRLPPTKAPAKAPTKATKSTTLKKDPVTSKSPPSKTGEKCGAKLVPVNSKTGKKNDPNARCKNPAGLGTDHPGWGHCKMHMGRTKAHSMQAAKKQVADRIQTYGGPIDIGPHEALLGEVHRTAGHVYWLGEQISNKDQSDLVQFTLKEGMTISAWVSMYQEERKMLVNVCRVAIAAGVAEKKVQLAEEQGKLMAMALMAFINDQALGLTPAQMVVARPLIGNILRSLPQSTEAGTIIDLNPASVTEHEEIPAR